MLTFDFLLVTPLFRVCLVLCWLRSLLWSLEREEGRQNASSMSRYPHNPATSSRAHGLATRTPLWRNLPRLRFCPWKQTDEWRRGGLASYKKPPAALRLPSAGPANTSIITPLSISLQRLGQRQRRMCSFSELSNLQYKKTTAEPADASPLTMAGSLSTKKSSFNFISSCCLPAFFQFINSGPDARPQPRQSEHGSNRWPHPSGEAGSRSFLGCKHKRLAAGVCNAASQLELSLAPGSIRKTSALNSRPTSLTTRKTSTAQSQQAKQGPSRPLEVSQAQRGGNLHASRIRLWRLKHGNAYLVDLLPSVSHRVIDIPLFADTCSYASRKQNHGSCRNAASTPRALVGGVHRGVTGRAAASIISLKISQPEKHHHGSPKI